MFDIYSEINVPCILKYFMYVPVVATNNQLLSRNLISQALIPPPPIPHFYSCTENGFSY